MPLPLSALEKHTTAAALSCHFFYFLLQFVFTSGTTLLSIPQLHRGWAGMEVTEGACPAVGSALLSLSHFAGAMPQETLFLPVWPDRAEVISL